MARLLWWRLWANFGAWLGIAPPFGIFFLWAHGHRVRPVLRWNGHRWRMIAACIRTIDK